jgi:hypothetical protein
LAWRHLAAEKESSAGLTVILLLALLPVVLLFVDWSSARTDLQAVVGASDGVTVQKTGVATAQAFDAFQQQAQGQVAGHLGQYLDAGDGLGTEGPFRVDSINSQPPAPSRGSTSVTVAYVPDLASRVEVVQGVPTGSRALGPTATMAQAGADRIGVKLFDTVCIRAMTPGAASSPEWCARIVGLWRPRYVDSQWTARNTTSPRLFTERDEFFTLSATAPPDLAAALRQYRPRPAPIAPQNTAQVAERVRDLRASVARAGAGEVRTSLDTSLERYTAARSAVSFPVRLLTASLVPLLALFLAALARWHVELRLHELALLRARGWASIRVQSLVLTQFVVLSACAAAVAGAGLLLLAWPAALGSIVLQVASPDRSDLVGIALAEGVLFATAATWFIWLARWAARQRVGQLTHPEAEPQSTPTQQQADRRVRLALPAALLLLLPRVIGTERWLPSRTLDDLSVLLVTVTGLAMFVVAVLPAMSLLAAARERREVAVDRTLAQWQLRHWWQRHIMAGFVIVFAFAMASFAAVSLAHQVLDRPAASGSPLGAGDTVSLAVGFASLVVIALVAYGLVFLFACRSRVDDYTALILDGLPAARLRRSLALEQHTVLLHGLLVGLGLGLLLAWTTSSIVGSGSGAGTAAASALIGVLSTSAIALWAGAGVAKLVRRSAVGFHLAERSRLGT